MSTWVLRSLAMIVLLADLCIVGAVIIGVGRDGAGWVALHYAPMRADSRCDATVARLRAAIRRQRQGEPTPEETALLEELRVSGACEIVSPQLMAIEAGPASAGD